MLLLLLLMTAPEPMKVRVNVKSADVGAHPTLKVYRGGPLAPVVTSCTVPCTLEVEVGIYYLELSGDGVHTGEGDLHAFGDMDITVRVGSSRIWAFGVTAVVAGSLFEIAGASMLAISFSTAPAPDLRLLIPAISFLVVGTICLIGGPILVAKSASTINIGVAPLVTAGGVLHGSTYSLSLRF